MKSIEDFEKTIGYSFKDKKLLKIALTHKSYLDENPDLISNQRYEFFGDTILDFDLTEYLFKHFPDLDEGSLTKIRSSAVNQTNLVKLGKEINIGSFMFLSKAKTHKVNLPIIKIGNWIGPLLVDAAIRKVKTVILFGYHGKLIKLAGVPDQFLMRIKLSSFKNKLEFPLRLLG